MRGMIIGLSTLAIVALPAVALADGDGTVTGAVGGAVAGAVVGGPVGVAGGVIGGAASGPGPVVVAPAPAPAALCPPARSRPLLARSCWSSLRPPRRPRSPFPRRQPNSLSSTPTSKTHTGAIGVGIIGVGIIGAIGVGATIGITGTRYIGETASVAPLAPLWRGRAPGFTRNRRKRNSFAIEREGIVARRGQARCRDRLRSPYRSRCRRERRSRPRP